MRPPWAIPLVLASSSPRRREILDRIGLPHRVVPPRYDEPAIDAGEPVRDYAQRLALGKAAAVVPGIDSGAALLAADTVVALGRSVLGKPAGDAEATEMLGRLSGRTHRVVTGLALRPPSGLAPGEPPRGWIRRNEGGIWTAAELTHVRFRPLDEREIAAYVSSGESLDKAGAYGIQGAAGGMVEWIRGCYLNVVGLPAALLVVALERVSSLRREG